MIKNYLNQIKLITLFVLLYFSGLTEAGLYKNTKEGVIEFSDRQNEYSEVINFDKKQNLISTESMVRRPSLIPQRPEIADKTYNVKILGIENEQTFRNIENLNIRVSVRPPFQFEMGQKLRLLINQKSVQPSQVGGSLFELSNIERGKHQFKAQLIDIKGRLLGESNDLTIFVHKHSILH